MDAPPLSASVGPSAVSRLEMKAVRIRRVGARIHAHVIELGPVVTLDVEAHQVADIEPISGLFPLSRYSE
jgi:hypothetical protein